ncbi:VirB2 family type IV secretion system major pilin TrwL [Bartonella quintana]|uniref:TrwL6 protein n=1 Tax=Bartonella quintana (strain Toulouse) TaxID=283165 RepID=Q6FYJ4_BARQU|nr:VirB2 family type IV secretion system major pilin TrwL [Bartonella quintana]AAM82220.1 TrwM-like protein [Bartonella quintana str. Toulouse]AFR26852.1 trwL6 protein [Bartonella quintana RM-11]QUG72421.1 TrbC/VirB2 family protein [Bartonella quintana]CAF26713.1 trwL6 protein [Bartonella quintana str. Toulouse]
MKQLDNLQSKSNNKIIAIAVAITVLFMAYPAYVQAQALNNAKTVLQSLQSELTKKIIPIAAALMLLCLAIGYAGRYIEKDTFIRWAVGVIIAGSATQIANMLLNQ